MMKTIWLASVFMVLMLSGCAVSSQARPHATSSSRKEMDQLAREADGASLELLVDKHPGIKAPEVKRVRFVEPNDWSSVFSDCMNEAGFQTKVDPDGGVTRGAMPAEQLEPYDLAVYSCHVKYPINPKFAMPLSSQELDYVYDYFVGDLKKCLTAEGIDVSDPPSRQRFHEIYGKANSWTPYADIKGVSQSKWNSIVKRCPEQPHGFRGQ